MSSFEGATSTPRHRPYSKTSEYAQNDPQMRLPQTGINISKRDPDTPRRIKVEMVPSISVLTPDFYERSRTLSYSVPNVKSTPHTHSHSHFTTPQGGFEEYMHTNPKPQITKFPAAEFPSLESAGYLEESVAGTNNSTITQIPSSNKLKVKRREPVTNITHYGPSIVHSQGVLGGTRQTKKIESNVVVTYERGGESHRQIPPHKLTTVDLYGKDSDIKRVLKTLSPDRFKDIGGKRNKNSNIVTTQPVNPTINIRKPPISKRMGRREEFSGMSGNVLKVNFINKEKLKQLEGSTSEDIVRGRMNWASNRSLIDPQSLLNKFDLLYNVHLLQIQKMIEKQPKVDTSLTVPLTPKFEYDDEEDAKSKYINLIDYYGFNTRIPDYETLGKGKGSKNYGLLKTISESLLQKETETVEKENKEHIDQVKKVALPPIKIPQEIHDYEQTGLHRIKSKYLSKPQTNQEDSSLSTIHSPRKEYSENNISQNTINKHLSNSVANISLLKKSPNSTTNILNLNQLPAPNKRLKKKSYARMSPKVTWNTHIKTDDPEVRELFMRVDHVNNFYAKFKKNADYLQRTPKIEYGVNLHLNKPSKHKRTKSPAKKLEKEKYNTKSKKELEEGKTSLNTDNKNKREVKSKQFSTEKGRLNVDSFISKELYSKNKVRVGPKDYITRTSILCANSGFKINCKLDIDKQIRNQVPQTFGFTDQENMVEDEDKENYRSFKGAQVQWPADLPDDILDDAIVATKRACTEFSVEGEGTKIAEQVKKHMDEKWEPHWHVFLGKSFGCHSTHEKNRFTFFTMIVDKNKISFLLYKSG